MHFQIISINDLPTGEGTAPSPPVVVRSQGVHKNARDGCEDVDEKITKEMGNAAYSRRTRRGGTDASKTPAGQCLAGSAE